LPFLHFIKSPVLIFPTPPSISFLFVYWCNVVVLEWMHCWLPGNNWLCLEIFWVVLAEWQPCCSRHLISRDQRYSIQPSMNILILLSKTEEFIWLYILIVLRVTNLV
jgi:hypothetical protein